MLDLTRQEKTILLFLAVSFVTGLGLNSYKKAQQKLGLSVAPYEIKAIREEADKFIEQQRFININSFNIDELTRLPGVGEKLARRIIEYHNLHGPFKTKKELMQVKGIGEKKFEKFKIMFVLGTRTEAQKKEEGE